MTSNNNLIPIKYDSYALIRIDKLAEIAAKHKLTGTDVCVYLTAVNNTVPNSCRLGIGIRKLADICNSLNINRHIKRLIAANLFKKIDNVYYVNPDFATKGLIVTEYEYDLFGCTCTEEKEAKDKRKLAKEHEERISTKGY